MLFLIGATSSESDSGLVQSEHRFFGCNLALIKHLFYNEHMDVFEKIKLTGLNMPLESAEDEISSRQLPDCAVDVDVLSTIFPMIQARLPNGQTIPLLKTMQTSVCEKIAITAVFALKETHLAACRQMNWHQQ